MVDLSQVVVIIPALNEEQSLPLVLAALPPTREVIVVDNGSTDRTDAVAHEGGATVVVESQRGYGAACLRGLAELATRRPAPRIVAFIDADFSDEPAQLPELISPILDGQQDFVLGSRLLGRREPGAMPPQSVYGNRFACWLMRMLFGARFTDLGPFRAIDYAALQSLEMADRNFGWTVEMQIKAVRGGLRCLEIPTPYRRRIGSSKISGTLTGTVKAGSKILYTVAKYGFARSAQRPSSLRAADDDRHDPRRSAR